MTIAPPVVCDWEGDVFRPLPRFAKLADKHFVIGERYPLIVNQERSHASHAAYFAEINTTWNNLPEYLAEYFPSPDHLRRYALIKAGFADQRQFVCGSKAEAIRLQAFVKPIDEYAVVTTSECVVTVWTAQSQSYRAMGKEAFQKSKQRVLDILAGMIGTTTQTLSRNAGETA